MKLRSFFLVTVISFGIMGSVVSADITKGQKWYTKGCKSCHGTGTKGASMHTQDEWDDLFANGGEKIIKAHANDKSAAYFNSDDFKNRAKDIRDFLFEYGSDSGNVPAC